MTEWNGVPENPEKDDLHYITDGVALWIAHTKKWTLLSKAKPVTPEWLATQGWAEYHGPCPTYEELRDREAAAYRKGQEDMRERAMEAARCVPIPEDACANETHGRLSAALHAAIAIRALPIKEARDD